MEGYKESVRKQFLYYKGLAEKAMSQVSDEQLVWTPDAETNSIAVIVQHVGGNMLSRFTDFLTSDGEKPWRNRDAEFEPSLSSRAELLDLWEKGWKEVFNALDQVEDLQQIVYIRNEGHTALEAFNRQLAHYSYHIGQIVFLAKLLKREEWQTLSIARNKSGEYNEKKFSAPKEIRHFTDQV
jgi:hypothetical protein